jgi:hypothetical protein
MPVGEDTHLAGIDRARVVPWLAAHVDGRVLADHVAPPPTPVEGGGTVRCHLRS